MHKLYVFLRSDLESLTVGKAAAQVAHAASQHAWRSSRSSSDRVDADAYGDWIDAGRELASGRLDKAAEDFGTTVVLDGGTFYPEPSNDILDAVLTAKMGGWVRDPTYPIRDGKVIHHIDLITCYWAFGDPDANPAFASKVKDFRLYSGNHD
jgi:hypothetical protein